MSFFMCQQREVGENLSMVLKSVVCIICVYFFKLLFVSRTGYFSLPSVSFHKNHLRFVSMWIAFLLAPPSEELMSTVQSADSATAQHESILLSRLPSASP